MNTIRQVLIFAAIFFSFFTLLFVYTKFIGPIPFSINSVTTNKSDAFNVTGTGKASAKPDLAYFSAGIQAQGSTVKQVQEQINGAANRISAAVKEAGVKDPDVQTINYNISPTYDYFGGSQRITGFQASTNLTVKIRELDRINGVIDAATRAGANQIGNITFDIEDKTKVENEARQKAVTEAKKSAEEAARMAGFSLGKIINYSENFGNFPRPILFNAKAEDARTEAPTSIETGTNEVQVSVTLSYEIR